jgi:hypothetical protein
MTALTGATLAETMARLGHSTPKAAMLYQQVASGSGPRRGDRRGPEPVGRKGLRHSSIKKENDMDDRRQRQMKAEAVSPAPPSIAPSSA